MAKNPMIEELNREFAIEGHIRFNPGEGGLFRALIANQFATAEVYLHGAHVTSFHPNNTSPVLWMSDLAQFQQEKAIRGGIPVVWPWFGPHPNDESKPQHGFARTSEWRVAATADLRDGSTQLCLQLRDNEDTRKLWPNPFELELRMTIGAQMRIELASRNTGAEMIEIGGALHTYFNVGNIENISIEGLGEREYIDQLEEHQTKRQSNPITVSEEIDRIYFDTEDECIIDDPATNRRIHIAKAGSRTTVIWNPWITKSRLMTDFPDKGYLNMMCIETANAAKDIYRVPPGRKHTLTQIISIE